MIKLELSDQMVAEIGEALNNHPYRRAAPVLMEIQRQITAQQEEKQPSDKPPNLRTVP